MEKLLTVVIPSYNVEKYLPEILPTYLDDALIPDIELLIVNDGSKDRTAEIGARYQAQYPQCVRLINKENGGHGSTINTGIDNARGKYFKVIDGDDWVDTGALKTLVERLKGLDCDAVLSPFVMVEDGTGRIAGKTEYGELTDGGMYSEDVLVRIARQKKYAMHAMTIKTGIIRKIPRISEHCFYVDMEYIAYPLEFIRSVAYVDAPVYQYRVGSAGQSMAMANMIRNRQMHMRVLQNLIDFYHRDICDTARQIVRGQIAGMCEKQLILRCCMPISRESKQEVTDFLAFIDEQIPEMKRDIPGKLNAVLIGSKGTLYWPVAVRYHQKYGVDRK